MEQDVLPDIIVLVDLTKPFFFARAEFELRYLLKTLSSEVKVTLQLHALLQ